MTTFYFGVQPPSTSVTWSASSNITSLNCSWFTTFTDPAQPSLTPADICALVTYNDSGHTQRHPCSWVGGACTGGVVDITGNNGVDWYTGSAACYNSPEDSLPAGTWELPTESQLLSRLSDEFVINTQPQVFQTGKGYWSSSAYANHPSNAWYASFSYGYGYIRFSIGNKSGPGYLVRCLH